MTSANLKKLRSWFSQNAANLPWRPENLDEFRDPYKVWISETMLQQTQVTTVQGYFARWIKRFPDIATLAQATEEEVFQYWQGLGYYSRARNILKTARQLAQQGGFPQERSSLEKLPGIGAYTAGAILSLAFHKQEPILDGNLVRIFSRYYLLSFLPTGKENKEIYWKCALKVASSTKAYMHNEALMELGRTVCKVKNPDCGNCPLKAGCRAFSEKRTGEFPPAKKRIQKEWHGTVLVVESSDEKILAVQGGQKFFSNQITLPHFETQKGAAIGLPIQAETIINADQVESIILAGSFRHNITIHKMSCDVLHIKLNVAAKDASKTFMKSDHCDVKNKAIYSWIEKAKASKTFANTFCLKSLQLV